MEFVAVIGLEIHIQMNTNSKMFSSAPNQFSDKPNTQVALFDVSFPGTLPSVNKQAVINAIRMANALNMSIDDTLIFERKNYFYSDLPKGYQLTQFYRPLGKDGYLNIDNRRIGIKRLHLEEDSCKQIHLENCTLIDFNRAGTPLIEIVTLPEISSGDEAKALVERIKTIAEFLEVSDAKMEEGSLRVDINISIKEKDASELSNKVEIKNVNSLSNIKKAIDFEIKRQKQIVESNGTIEKETRRFDDSISETVPMRFKEEENDYRYFTEPNIPPIKLSKEFIDEAIKASKELPEVKYQRYLQLGLNEYSANQILSNKSIAEYFEEMLNHGCNAAMAANWIIDDVQSYLNRSNININEFGVEPVRLAMLIHLIEVNSISIKQAKEIFDTMIKTHLDPNQIVKEMGVFQINDEIVLSDIVRRVVELNPSALEDYKNGKDRIVSYLVGKVMEETKGKANPTLTNQLVKEELKRR